MKFFYKILLLVSLSSCFSSSDGDKDLDIPLKASDEVVVSKSNNSQGLQNGAMKKVPVSSVVKWQNFFQAPPSLSERKLIETKLNRWVDSESVLSLMKKARNETVIGRLKNAEISYRTALRKDSDNIEALLELSSLYLRKKELSRAFETMEDLNEKMLEKEQVSTDFKFRYRFVLALSLMARGDVREGRNVLSDLIGIDKSFTPAYVALATSYTTQNKLKVAEFIAQRGIDRGKESPALYNILGIVEEKKGFYEKAEQWYTKSISIMDSYAPAQVNKANLLIKQFQYEEAETYLLKALMYHPSNEDALVSLGIVKKKRGNFDGAKSSFVKALEINPENSIARFNLATLMLNAFDRPNEAIRLFHEVVQTSKNNRDLKKTAENYINDIKENRESY